MAKDMTWKFDQEVARTFPSHARSHIPQYESVISQCVDICDHFGKDAAIIDVGVATGETISHLHSAGFHNLFGVDNSQDMLNACPQDIATLICSETFPRTNPFDVVLMNWTLHFITDKRAYLRDIFKGLKPGGALVLSEKTSLDPFPHKFYHEFKRRNGLSEEQIAEKAKSLENVMHINDIPWYYENLPAIGFQDIQIINAFWCFSTFVCFKPAA